MNLRTYRAYTMAEALSAVKRDLGPDAVILNTRTSRTGGIFGIGRTSIVEVTAVAAEEAAAPRAKKRRPMQSASAARAYAGDAKPPAEKSPTEPPKDVARPEDRRKTQEFARQMLARFEATQHDDADSVNVTAPVINEQPPAAPAKAAEPIPESAPKAEPVARRFVLNDPAAKTGSNTGTSVSRAQRPESQHIEPKPNGTADDRNRQSPVELDQMQSELSAIRQMVGQVLQRQGSSAPPNMPEKLFEFYLQLVGQDLSEELADSVIDDVRRELDSTAFDDEQAVREALQRVLAAYVPCSDEPMTLASPDDRPLTIVLVGPTGVGKTTTLAKLAATMKLQHDLNIGLITSDTYRIAAVEQLRTYAGIIGLPVEVVLTPAEISRAVARMQHLDAILIDTAGRSQRDSGRIDELRRFVEAAQPHEVHLVLSSTASEKVMMQEAEAFACVGVDKLVFTKLDEAVSFGMLINVARQLGTQLSFLTTGQEVPDHLEIGQPARLAELVLGGALHS